ncbi:MAG: aminopeptidase [Caldilineae bacterium]|nr:MAG: aminopeptidase [Caldilineae bacterium]
MALTFEQKLQNYAELAIRVGLNLQPGQRLMIRRAPIDCAPLVRALAASAYKAGARLVDVNWQDEQLILTRFQHAPRDSFTEYPDWRAEGLLKAVQRGDAMLSLHGVNPRLLDGQDPELVSIATKTAQEHTRPALEFLSRDGTNWLVFAAPTPSWAAHVFPDAPPEEQIARLWDAVFAATRADRPDPIAEWERHIQQLRARSRYLTAKQYTALHYTAPGTDFTLGLPKGHIWKSAGSHTQTGIPFTANIPTEEVYTLPHREQADGVVTASMPLNYNGTLIENFTLTFANGRVTKITAQQGETILQRMVDTDDGAGRLGEVALVPHSSPIAQSGILFYNTLFDENASCHLALGRAYPVCLEGGTEMEKPDFEAAGGNNSLIHVDFMVGSAKMNIDGITENGDAEPVMRNGEWAFEV